MTTLFLCPTMEVKGAKTKKGVIRMAESNKQDVILMAILAVTKDDVLAGANELGIPEEQVTDDVIQLVKEKLGQSLHNWRKTIQDMVKEVIEKESLKCPLGMVCSTCCIWSEVGECTLSREVK